MALKKMEHWDIRKNPIETLVSKVHEIIDEFNKLELRSEAFKELGEMIEHANEFGNDDKDRKEMLEIYNKLKL